MAKASLMNQPTYKIQMQCQCHIGLFAYGTLLIVRFAAGGMLQVWWPASQHHDQAVAACTK